MDTKKELGSRINSALSLRDKKQKELANALGVTANTISYFCGGSRIPNIEQLIKIADYLDVSTDYLLGRTHDPNLKPSATDELGLTLKSIDWITSKNTDPFWGAEFRKYFNLLLEMQDFQLLIDSLFDCFAVAQALKIDADSYQIAYHEHPDDATKREGEYKTRITAETLQSLNSRVSFFIQASNEFERLYEKFPAFAAVLDNGKNSNYFYESAVLQSIVENRANRQLAKILTEIEFNPNVR